MGKSSGVATEKGRGREAIVHPSGTGGLLQYRVPIEFMHRKDQLHADR